MHVIFHISVHFLSVLYMYTNSDTTYMYEYTCIYKYNGNDVFCIAKIYHVYQCQCLSFTFPHPLSQHRMFVWHKAYPQTITLCKIENVRFTTDRNLALGLDILGPISLDAYTGILFIKQKSFWFLILKNCFSNAGSLYDIFESTQK